MSEWKTYKMRELCSDIIDCVNKTAPISDVETPYKMLRTSDIRDGRINLENLNSVSADVFSKWTRRGALQAGDVIFTREAPLGEVGLVRIAENYFLGQRLVLFRANPDVCDNRFLMYSLLYHENKQAVIAKGVGATVLHLRVPECEKIEIKAPSLRQQKRIADILSAYDDLIENNQKQIKLLEEAAQRLYKEWFVDLRFPGHETTPIINGIPEGWNEGLVQDIVTYHDKKRKPLSGMQRSEMQGFYRYYGAAGILDYVNDYLFNGTYLLLGEDGTVITEDGYPILQFVTGKFWVNNHAHVLTGKNGYPVEYLYMMFKAIKVNDVVTGVAQPKISQARLSNKKILIPDLYVVKAYCNIAKPVFDIIFKLERQSNLCKEARDRLLPKLMNGEIEV